METNEVCFLANSDINNLIEGVFICVLEYQNITVYVFKCGVGGHF